MSPRSVSHSVTPRTLLAVLWATVFVPSFALAQESVLLDDFDSCAGIEDDDAQLACFRETLNSLKRERAASAKHKAEFQVTGSMPAEPDLKTNKEAAQSIVSEEPVLQESSVQEMPVRRRNIQVRPANPEPDEQAPPSEEVRATITAVRRNFFGKIIATLDNGQVWQEIDGSHFRGNVRVGSTAVIVRRKFGGFQMKVDQQPGVVLVRRGN